MMKYGFPLIAMVILTLAIYSIVKTRPVHAIAPPPSAPPVAGFAKSIGAVGLVEPSSENIAISVAVPGLVTQVFVHAGDHVTKGQKLFLLDDRDQEAELMLRRSSLALAEAKLQKLVKSPRPEDLPPAEARVQAAEESLKDADVQMRLMESVKDKRAIRDEDLQRRRLAVKASDARLAEAKANLALLKAGAWQPDLDVARAEVAEAKSLADQVQANINRLTVTAPIEGDILQCKVHVGEYAPATQLAQPLILMGSTRPVNVRADIDEQDAWQVKAGADATASVRGNSETRFRLQFLRFEPYVIPKKSLTGDSTERVDTRVLQAIFRLDERAPVYVGQQMDVFINAAEKARP